MEVLETWPHIYVKHLKIYHRECIKAQKSLEKEVLCFRIMGTTWSREFAEGSAYNPGSTTPLQVTELSKTLTRND